MQLAKATVKATKNNEAGLVAYSEPKSAAAEAYRTLRTNITFANPDKPVHTLLVTSTSPDDGKSTTIANLAITFAASGSPTVLVDADLRRPHLHTIFGVSNEAGLTTMVADMARIKDGSVPKVPLQSTQVENLQLLTSGPVPPNPAEILGSQKMTELLALLRSSAEYVLIDTPPVIAVTGGVSISAYSAFTSRHCRFS